MAESLEAAQRAVIEAARRVMTVADNSAPVVNPQYVNLAELRLALTALDAAERRAQEQPPENTIPDTVCPRCGWYLHSPEDDMHVQSAPCNLTKGQYNNLVRDAMKWRAQERPAGEPAFMVGQWVWYGGIQQQIVAVNGHAVNLERSDPVIGKVVTHSVMTAKLKPWQPKAGERVRCDAPEHVGRREFTVWDTSKDGEWVYPDCRHNFTCYCDYHRYGCRLDTLRPAPATGAPLPGLDAEYYKAVQDETPEPAPPAKPLPSLEGPEWSAWAAAMMRSTTWWVYLIGLLSGLALGITISNLIYYSVSHPCK